MKILSDSGLSLQMEAKDTFKLGYKITDIASNAKLSGVTLTIDDEEYLTDDAGEVSITLFEGLSDVSLDLVGYQHVNQTINLMTDTLVSLPMV